MKKTLLAGVCLLVISGSSVLAQNKTLGVGVTTPNPNAALHVESPTGNQGFILPRLTSAQRTATGFTALLGAPDNGLMVYDTDLNTIFIWNGTAWQTTAEVAGGARLGYPYKDSVTVATGTPDLFVLKYLNAENKRVMRVENLAATNGSSAMSVYNIGTGLAGYFEVSNPATTASTLYAVTNSDAGGAPAPVAVYGESNGTGALGGSFRNTNAGNALPALWAETLGSGVALHAVTATGFSAIQGEATGGVSNGVTGISKAADPGSYAILGTNMGGGPAGVFNITSATNSSRVVSATTAGQGPAGYFEQTNIEAWSPALMARADGQGAAFNATATSNSANANAAEFVVENPANPRNAIMATTLGVGSVASFNLDNTKSTASAVNAETNGTGPAVRAVNKGVADGFAGTFENTEPNNTYPAIQASTVGGGSGVRVIQAPTSTGIGMDVIMQNTTSTMPGFSVRHEGLGRGGEFIVVNNTSNASALVAETNGVAPALTATSTGTGSALQVSGNSNGMAIEMTNGGLKYSVASINAPGQISVLAAVYKVNIAGQGIVVSLPANPADGTFCKVFNESGSDVTVDPVYVLGVPGTVTIPLGGIRDFIFLSGNWYENP